MNNCTLVGNFAYDFSDNGQGGGGAYLCSINNCILYFNAATEKTFGANNGFNYDDGSIVNYSCTYPMPTSGIGNITNDPLFVNTNNNWADLRLRPGSPCIDSGTNLLGLINTDFTGLPRPLDGDYDGVAQFDMGAYEFNPYGSEPQPLQVGSYDTSSFATDVAVLGNYAFVADGAAGLQVIEHQQSHLPCPCGRLRQCGLRSGRGGVRWLRLSGRWRRGSANH